MTRAYGRVTVPEPYSGLTRLHWWRGERLAPVTWEPRVPVLNQENLLAQGIHVSRLVPGAADVNQLGSCVANAAVTALSVILAASELDVLGLGMDAAADEEHAIRLYHAITDMTRDPALEWPPSDCGTSGLAACDWLQRQHVISGSRIAHTAEAICSLLQAGPVICGQPFLYAWEDPAPGGLIDGDGSPATLEAMLKAGVAGGHETCWTAIERITFRESGGVDERGTVIRFANSWGTGWGDAGYGRAHLSTFMMLAPWCDFRQLTP